MFDELLFVAFWFGEWRNECGVLAAEGGVSGFRTHLPVLRETGSVMKHTAAQSSQVARLNRDLLQMWDFIPRVAVL